MSTEFDIHELVAQALKQAQNNLGRANILIAGRVGVGKSTLVNAVFQGDLATTGQGLPVTKETREYRKEGLPLSIFDSRGLEMADFDETLAELTQAIASRSKDADPSRHIHVAWLCIAEDSRRVEPAEIKLVSVLSQHMPVIAVITKARADHGFRDEVQRLLPETRNVIRVMALPETLDDGHSLGPMGLNELVTITMEVIPEGTDGAFVAAQKVNLNLKKSRAHQAVVAAATAAGAAGAAPIPFADAAVLVPIQVAMLAKITAIFGIPLDIAFLSTLISSVVTSGTATLIGRGMVAELLKLVPGAGPVVGGVISGGVAAALTTAFGETYIAVLIRLLEKNNGVPPASDDIVKAFKKELRAQRRQARTGELVKSLRQRLRKRREPETDPPTPAPVS